MSKMTGEVVDPPLLEVIALDATDAIAAERGGADRLELVSSISVGGLTPDVSTFEAVRDAVEIPIRVMLRTNSGFGISHRELDDLRHAADQLRSAGANEFVFGFIARDRELDVVAMQAICEEIGPSPFTLHHAFDHLADARTTWDTLTSFPGLDWVLSGGEAGDLTHGIDRLCSRAGWQTDSLRWLAGGGLEAQHIPVLARARIAGLHSGRAARQQRSWDLPVDAQAVRRLRAAIESAAG